MAWTLGGTRIYVQKSNEGTGQILPRLQPLQGATVIQSFGHESLIRNVTALVVGDTNKNALRTCSQNEGVSYEFVSPEGSLGNFFVKSLQVSRTDATCQTIDTLQPETAPVYEVEMELFLDD